MNSPFGRARCFLISALAVFCLQTRVLAHAPIVFQKPLVIHSHSLSSVFNLLLRGNAKHSSLPVPPLSGASRAFALQLKTLSNASLRNTLLYGPLNNISGQFTGVDYYAVSNGVSGPFYHDIPNVFAFGSSNPMNIGLQSGAYNVSLTNVITSGLPKMMVAPSIVFGHAISGAQRATLSYYEAAAASGNNLGISILQHPTGGLLYGTLYYQNYSYSYPGFEAFGNNPFASEAVASSVASHPLMLTQPLQSYLQFGKFTRPISNGFVFGTYYSPNTTYNPPYGAGAPGPYRAYWGYFSAAVGSNSFNTGLYQNVGLSNLPFFLPSYLK